MKKMENFNEWLSQKTEIDSNDAHCLSFLG